MPEVGAFQGALLFALMVAVLLWFALGTQGNIRRGNRYLAWLQDGLPLLGKKAKLRWLGSSVAELTLESPLSPHRKVEVLCVLEARDLPIFWLLGRARGRRDFLILRASLHRSPQWEGEVGNDSGWTRSRVRTPSRIGAGEQEPGWQLQPWDEPGVSAAVTATTDFDVLRQAWREISAAAGGVWRIAVRRDDPHVEVHVPLYPPDERSSKALVGAFRGFSERVAGG